MPEVTENGGSTLLAYELMSDDGLQSELDSIYIGLNRTVEIKTVPSRTYRFSFRVQNVIGWSGYSGITYILAAYVPEKPDSKPQLFSVDATQITISLSPRSISNGDVITDFVLYVQEGQFGLPVLQDTYPISKNEIQLIAADLSMTVGEHYFFTYTYRNGEGDSPHSDATEIALADYPTAPDPVTKSD